MDGAWCPPRVRLGLPVPKAACGDLSTCPARLGEAQKSRTSSQVQDHLPAVTGPWGVREDERGLQGGRAFRPQEERPLCPQASLFPSLLLVV